MNGILLDLDSNGYDAQHQSVPDSRYEVTAPSVYGKCSRPYRTQKGDRRRRISAVRA